MKYEAIIYDLDGTLLDTIAMNMYPLIKIIKEELGIEKTFEEVKHCFSMTGKQTLDYWGIDYERVYPRWVQYVNEFEEGATPYENVEKVLKTLHQKQVRQAVVSAKLRKQYEIDFVSRGFDQYIEVEVLADDTDKHKPDPEPIYLCLEKLRLNKEDVIYIGDALSDYQVCINAGIDFAYAKWGSVSNKGIENPTIVLDEPLDILNKLF